MKKNKLFKILCLLLFIVTGFVFADEEKKALPSKGEVVLVFSLKVLPTPDSAFFSNYRNIKFGNFDFDDGSVATDQIYVNYLVHKYFLSAKCDEDPQKTDFVMKKISLQSNKRIINLYKLVYFFGNAYCAQLTLPIQSELTIPEDVKFVYLGDFTIKCSMPFYDISEIKRIDNFDAAALAVKKAYGKSAELERVPLVPLKK